jgi:hypothetical protein
LSEWHKKLKKFVKIYEVCYNFMQLLVNVVQIFICGRAGRILVSSYVKKNWHGSCKSILTNLYKI